MKITMKVMMNQMIKLIKSIQIKVQSYHQMIKLNKNKFGLEIQAKTMSRIRMKAKLVSIHNLKMTMMKNILLIMILNKIVIQNPSKLLIILTKIKRLKKIQ